MLRQARESFGLSRAELADYLHIGSEQLEALESADRERLPEPVFVIAQARRVAAALQIDVAPQLEALRVSGELAAPPRPTMPAKGPSPSRVLPLPSHSAAAGSWASLAQFGLPLLVVSGVLLLPAGLWGLWRQAPRSASGGNPPLRALPAPGTTPAARAIPESAVSPAAPPASDSAATLKPGTLALESREPSWVEVRRPDGVYLFRGLLQGSRIFPAGDGLQVLAGRPDLVTSRYGAATARVLGPINEVRWLSLPARP